MDFRRPSSLQRPPGWVGTRLNELEACASACAPTARKSVFDSAPPAAPELLALVQSLSAAQQAAVRALAELGVYQGRTFEERLAAPASRDFSGWPDALLAGIRRARSQGADLSVFDIVDEAKAAEEIQIATRPERRHVVAATPAPEAAEPTLRRVRVEPTDDEAPPERRPRSQVLLQPTDLQTEEETPASPPIPRRVRVDVPVEDTRPARTTRIVLPS